MDGVDTTVSAQDSSDVSIRPDGALEIAFSTKIEYMGPNSQTIAFLKREDFAKLDLNQGMELEKVLDASITSPDSSQTPGEVHSDLSSQIQVVNLGYLG